MRVCVCVCVCVCVAVIGVSCLTLHISLLSFFSVPVCVLSVKQSEHLCLYDCGVSVCVCICVCGTTGVHVGHTQVSICS